MNFITKKLSLLLFLCAFIFHISDAQTTPRDDFKLKVMSYNVHHCNPPETNKIDVDLIANVIRKQNPDIVAVQEVDVLTNRSGKIDQARLLSQKSGLEYYYFAKTMDYDGGQYGILILSKYPLSDTITYRLPSTNPSKDEPRVLAVATIRLLGNKAIRFGSTHLEAFNHQTRLEQAKEINKIAEKSSLSMIIAGDFNSRENSDVIQTLDKSFTRTCTQCANTFWEDGDSGAIDYVMYRPAGAFSVKEHTVIDTEKASDHFPIISLFEY